MDTKLLVFIIISALCWGVVGYGVSRMNGEVIEAVDDEDWTCQALGKTDLLGLRGETLAKIAKGDELHLLASNSDQPDKVMVQTADGIRGWVDNSILPNYYKIRSIETDEPAQFSAKTFEQKIIGEDFTTLQERYAVALQVVPKKKTKSQLDENGFTAVFPMRVHTKGLATTTRYATIEFADGRAVAVTTDTVSSKKAIRDRINPLIFFCLDRGIFAKAGQKASPAYTSKLPEGVEKHNDFGWIGSIFGLLLGLIGLVVLAAFPVLLVSPLVVLVYLNIYDDFYKRLLAILLMAVSIIVCFTFFSITSSVSYLLFIGNIAAAIVMLVFCENSVY